MVFPHGEIDRIPGTLTPNVIYNHIVNSTHVYDPTVYTYIITGKPGATGKSHLCVKLKEAGFNAIEISELISPLVKYEDGENHFIRDYIGSTILIVLNKPL